MQTLAPYLRAKTFDAAAAIVDADGIKTSIASAASIQTYTTFNGSSTLGTGFGSVTHTGFASWPSVTNTSATGSYVAGSTVVFTGTWGKEVVSRTATITSADGGATYIADGPLDHGSITSIVVAAQVDTSGAFTFGWSGVGPKRGYAWALLIREAGTMKVDHADGGTDSWTEVAQAFHRALVTRVYGTVTIDFTAFEIERA